jgi:hypothetical protein
MLDQRAMQQWRKLLRRQLRSLPCLRKLPGRVQG